MFGAWFYTFSTSTLKKSPSWALAWVGGIAPLACVICYAFLLPEPEVETLSTAEKEKEGIVLLPWRDKLRIIRPMFVPYMLPLATIFFVENAVTQVSCGGQVGNITERTQGIFPTLLFYLPLQKGSFFFADLVNRMGIFKENRDFYPFYVSPVHSVLTSLTSQL
jgi:hypothetical protein